MTLGADQFFPKPGIDSMVLRIDFKTRPDHPAEDEDFLFQVIKAAFGQRRKTLKNALQGRELHMGGESAAKVLERAGIDPFRRAETLDVKEFVALSAQVKKERNEGQG
jgi:16S rRNA (adenine1518-N6/adenine1519-N6)-dimethyltransferase